MILSKYVRVNSHPRNKRRYLALGYEEKEGIFQVKVSDLSTSSATRVDVQCDYCGSLSNIRYADYTQTISKYIDKDACLNCAHLKREDILQHKLKNNNVSFNTRTRGRWQNEQYVLGQLEKYIEEQGHIGRKKETELEWMGIIRGLTNLNIDIDDAVKQLGYSVEELWLRRPNGYYDDFETLKEDLNHFINEHDRFPTQVEMANELGIYRINYEKHGTIDEIKMKMGYCDKEDLVDLTGYINKSSYELIVANYLIEYDIPYKRDQFPFKKINNKYLYRSDFTFYLTNGEELHCEIWGGKRDSPKEESGIFESYNETMEIKLNLYKKYNIRLISINPEVFTQPSIELQKTLYKIFSPYFQMTFKEVDYSLLSTSTLKNMSDDELIKKVMKYSIDGTLPTSNYLRSINKEFLFVEVIKRHKHYINFAKKYSLDTKRKHNNYWTQEKVFEAFDYMIKVYGRLLSSHELRKNGRSDINIKNLDDRIYSMGGITEMKLCYYEHLLREGKEIPFSEHKYLLRISTGKGNHRATLEQQKKSQKILDNINKNID